MRGYFKMLKVGDRVIVKSRMLSIDGSGTIMEIGDNLIKVKSDWKKHRNLETHWEPQSIYCSFIEDVLKVYVLCA